jgi:hypothetical protein
MTWTSNYGAQRACLKGLGASGPKELEPIYYPILYSPAEVKTYSTNTSLYEELGLVIISSQHII